MHAYCGTRTLNVLVELVQLYQDTIERHCDTEIKLLTYSEINVITVLAYSSSSIT